MLEANGLTKRFGSTAAVRGVTLRVEAGEFAGLLGPNAAGKTTLLKLFATVLRPSEGSLRIGGRDAVEDGASVRRLIGATFHEFLLYDELTVEQNLRFVARLYGLKDWEARVQTSLRRFGLEHRARDPVRGLSRGLKQRLSLARALQHDPRLLLLDEPFTGLDVQAQQAFKDTLVDLGRDVAVVLSSHDPALVRSLARRVVVLDEGTVRLDAHAAALGHDFARQYAEMVGA